MVRDVTSGLPTSAEKPRYVATMFGRIARRYDLLNTLMTFGLDAGWRRAVASELNGGRVLDVGAGTGRLAIAIREAQPASHVVCADFTLAMLAEAPSKL